MTLPISGQGPLATLTALNQRIIAQVEEGTVAEEAAENEILGGGDVDIPDPDTEEEEPEVRGRFHNEDPFEFNRIKEWIEANVFGGETTGMTPLINAFVDEWDEEYRRRQGLAPDESIDDGATLERLLENDEFLNGATWLPLTSRGDLPPIFTTSLPEIGEDGEETGGTLLHIAVASPLTGVTFRTVEEVAAQETPETAATFRKLLRSASDLSRALFSSAIKQQKTDVLPIASRTDVELTDVGSRGGEGIRSTGRPPQPPIPAPPEISSEQLTAMWEDAVGGGGRGRRGGGGGGVRRDIQFDRDHLIAQVSDRWRSWMLDPNPPPEDWIGAQVDTYVREARAFWSGQGIQLDFETFINEKLRAHPRWAEIYKWKTPSETEEQFMGRFFQPISNLGQTGEFTRAQTEAAVRSGGSPTEQLQRVMGTREVQMSGGFSQRLARTLAGIGVG